MPFVRISSRASLRAVAVLAAGLAVFLAACQPSSSEVADYINAERRAAGLAELGRAGDLDAKAQQHAEWMAANQRLAHSDLDAGVEPGWKALAENVGAGSELASVHATFMSSPSHRDHILDKRFRDFGVGAARSANNTIYVAVVFRG